MNRRSFFNSLSSAVAGVYLGCHIDLKKIIQIHTSQDGLRDLVVVNQEWVDAPYEVAFVASGKWAFPKGLYPEFKEVIPVRIGSNGEIIPKFTYT